MEARLREGRLFPEPKARPERPEPVAGIDVPHTPEQLEDIRGRFYRGQVQVAVEKAVDSEAPERWDDLEFQERFVDYIENLEESEDTPFAVWSIGRTAQRICRDLGVRWDAKFWTVEDERELVNTIKRQAEAAEARMSEASPDWRRPVKNAYTRPT